MGTTTRKTSAKVSASVLDDLRNGSRPAVKQSKTDKHPLAKAASAANADMPKRDRDYLLGSVEVVRMALEEALTGARSALSGLTVDPAAVTLTQKGAGDVSANLPVRYDSGAGSRYLNFTVTLSGTVAEYLIQFAGPAKEA